MGRGPQGAHCSGQVTGLRTQGRHQLLGERGSPMRGSVWTTPLVSNIPFVSTGANWGSGHPTQCSLTQGDLSQSHPPPTAPRLTEMARLAPQTLPGDPPSSFQAGPPTTLPQLQLTGSLQTPPVSSQPSLHASSNRGLTLRAGPHFNKPPPGPALVLTPGPSRDSAPRATKGTG